MARKKRKTFSAVKQVKAMARKAIGTPPPTQPIPNKKRRDQQRAAKHKSTPGRILSEES